MKLSIFSLRSWFLVVLVFILVLLRHFHSALDEEATRFYASEVSWVIGLKSFLWVG